MNAVDGMGLHPQIGLITWTPTEAQIGTHAVTVVAEDGRHGIGGQHYTLTVTPANVPPTISISAPGEGREAEEGKSLTIRADATDSDDGLAQVEFFVDGVSIGSSRSAPYELQWTAAGLGEQTLTAVATDADGASTTSAPVSITVIEPLPDTEAPIVTVTVNPTPAQIGEPVTLLIDISDASAIDSVTLDINGVNVPVQNGQAVYTPQETGFFTATVTATDSAGNSGSGSAVFGVSDGSDTTPPQVDLHDDVEFQCVEIAADLYEIVGSVSDDGEARYTLRSREKGSQTWKTLAEGVTASLDGVLATFDPTIHRNGIHELWLTAEDTAGHLAEVTGCLLVDGRFKVGQSSIGGIDFNLPQLGYPLLAGRVYDSRNLDGGSFGPGWSLPHEGSNVQAEFTYAPSEGWGQDVQGGLFSTYILVPRSRKVLALRMGEQVFKFRMEVTPKTSFMRPIMDNATPLTVSYVAVDGTTGTLETPGADPQVFLFSANNGTLASAEGDDYNPALFRLTLEDGSVYLFDKHKGLLSMTDPYGHAIAYSDSGISHSSGASLSFERDTTSDRIERIVDDLGRTIEYRYGDDGMLQQVIQKGGGSYATRVLENYAYNKGINETPVLKDIIAPDGTRLGTFEYDSQGRKVGLIDHEGNRVLFGYDAPEHHYTVTDRRGNPTSYSYDSDGNVTAVTDAEGHTERYSYDADGNVLSKTNKMGYTTAYTYDTDGNKLSETDPLGHTTSYIYDNDGNMEAKTDPLGHTIEFTYDTYGKRLTRKDARGNVTSYVYDDDGRQVSHTDALGNTVSSEYDAQGNLTKQTDPLGNSVEYTYDLYGRTLSTTDERGNTTTKTTDPQGNMLTMTDALGHTTSMTYHHTGKVLARTDAAGHVTRNQYDSNGNLLTRTDPTDHSTSYSYDENENQTATTYTVTTEAGLETVTMTRVYDRLNRVVEQIDAEGLTSEIRYDAAGRQTGSRDGHGNWSLTEYDARGLRIRTVAPDGREQRSEYDEAGRLRSTTDERERATTYEYDEVGNVTNITRPNGTFVTYEYDALNRRVKTITSKGLTTSRIYDRAGRLSEETDPLGLTTRYQYYPDGTRWKTIDPRGNVTEYIYDANGQLAETRLPDGSVSYAYNETGRKIAETDQLGHSKSFEWDADGRLQTLIDPLGQETSYAYNELGNLISQTDANRHVTTFGYDKVGKRIRKTYPLGMSQTTSYDVQSRTVSVTDYNGDTLVRQYDRLGRLARLTFPAGSGTETVSYTYTATGQIESVSDSRGTTGYIYDDEDRPIERLDPDGTVVSYSYETCCTRVTSVTVDSRRTEYAYDEYDRLESVTDADGNTVQYTYDAYGNTAGVIYPNGITTEYGYDTLNRLTTMNHSDTTGMLSVSYHYTLNAKGQRKRVEEQPAGRIVEYAYDDVDRLVKETIATSGGSLRTISYSYDPVGNRIEKNDCRDAQPCVSTTYTYDDNDRLLTENGYSYTYDDNGNMLTKIPDNVETHGRVSLQYNALNRLTHAHISTPQGVSNVEYAYDHDGIRVGKTLNGEYIGYVLDNNRPYAQVLEERSVTGEMLVSYVYGKDLLSRTTGPSTGSGNATSYYLYDGFSSVRGLSDANGSVTGSYVYDAYGMLLDGSAAAANPYRYRGEQYDAELEAYYLRARYYQPGSGRFLTTDPVEGLQNAPITQHRYLYGNNNPVSYIDPSGESALGVMSVVASIGILVGINHATSYYPDAPVEDGFCGPDVTDALDKALAEISNAFEDEWLPNYKKVTMCEILHNFQFAETAWDIRELLFIGSDNALPEDLWDGVKNGEGGLPAKVNGNVRGNCEFTVAYHGKCHNAGFLNYLMWGVANRKCSERFPSDPKYHLSGLKSKALWRKKLKRRVGLNLTMAGLEGEIDAAITAGYTQPSGGCPLSRTEHAYCTITGGNAVSKGTIMGWQWGYLRGGQQAQ